RRDARRRAGPRRAGARVRRRRPAGPRLSPRSRRWSGDSAPDAAIAEAGLLEALAREHVAAVEHEATLHAARDALDVGRLILQPLGGDDQRVGPLAGAVI